MDKWIVSEGRNYCSDKCFEASWPKCEACRTPIKEWLVAKDGRRYCSDHCISTTWPRCVVCDRPMDRWVETDDGKRYCGDTCLQTTLPTCGVCARAMKQWIETEGGARYCSESCASTELPCCDACGVPMHKWHETAEGLFCSDLCRTTERQFRERLHSTRRPGVAYGVAGNTATYSDQVLFGAARGHGFAAENANHLADKALGRDAQHIGGDFAKNGADRVVDGQLIQTKYCRTGAKCVAECFDQRTGQFKYLDAAGKPMQIEVPSDKYDGAVQALRERIRRGQVPGVSDPREAENLIRKGRFTYEQVRNIAKAGTVESLLYDAATGAVVSASAGGISFAITFAYALWNGQDLDKALKQACYAGLEVGGITWVSSVAMAQVGRTGAERALRPVTDVVVEKLGSSATKVVANLGRTSGKALTGAAATSHASKALRGNIVTGVVTTAVLSLADMGRLVSGKISGAQAFKNVTTNAASVAGGSIGWAAGGAAGAKLGALAGSVVPGAGTAVGAAVGWFIGAVGGAWAGSSAASAGTKAVLDQFIQDDAKEMLRLLEGELQRLAYNHLLSESELDRVVAGLQNLDVAAELRNIYAADNRRAYVTSLLKPLVARAIADRQTVMLPERDKVLAGARAVVEQLV